MATLRQARIKRGLCSMCGRAARQAGRKLCGGCVFVRRCLSGARRRFLGSYHCNGMRGPADMPRPTGPEVRYRTLCVLHGINGGVVACACRSNNNERYIITRVGFPHYRLQLQ